MNRTDDAAKVRFFPPGIPLLTIFAGILLNRLLPLSFRFPFEPPIQYIVGGTTVAASMMLLGFWSVLLFRRAGQNENPWKPSPCLELRGPFRWTRNPMYLQMVLVCIGIAIILANWWIVILTPVTALLLQYLAIIPEEQYLESKFGEQYLAYKRKVRRWL